MEIRERSVRDQGEISGDQPEISVRSVRDQWRSVEIRERSSRDQGEINQRSMEIGERSVRGPWISVRSVKEQCEISGDH